MAACKGVAKLAKYWSIQLCHRICPKNWLSALAFADSGAFKISFTLSGSTTMLLLLTICFNNVLVVTLEVTNVELELMRLETREVESNEMKNLRF